MGDEAIRPSMLVLRTDPDQIEWAKTNAVEMNSVNSELLKGLRKREVCPVNSTLPEEIQMTIAEP